MPTYLLSAYQASRRREELGAVELPCDDTAREFARRVIRDILRDNPRNYSGWVLDISREGRTVAGIPYKVRQGGAP